MRKVICRPNVKYNYERKMDAKFKNQLEFESQFDYISYISKEDLKKISEKIIKSFKSHKIKIVKCVHCNSYLWVYRKDYLKYKEALNKKFGGWSCYYCGQLRYNNKLRPGQQVAYDQLKENSKYYKKIYDKKLNKEMELQGVKVTNY